MELPPAASAHRTLKVLLVEDSKILTDRLSETIEHIKGINLVGVADTEAIAIAMTRHEEVDVIVLDLHLRQGTGFGVMRALTASHHKPAIIILTNYDLPEYTNAALALGATHFLDKARDYRLLPEILVRIRQELSVLH